MRKAVLLLALLAILSVSVFSTSAQTCPTDGRARLRVAHFALLGQDDSRVNIYLNRVSSRIQNVSFGDITSWENVRAGVVDVAVVPRGGTGADAVISLDDVTLCAGGYYTIVAHGLGETNTLALQPIAEDFTPLAEGFSRVTIFHAIANAPAVDVVVNGGALISNLTYPGDAARLGISSDPAANDGYAIRTVPAGLYAVDVTVAGDAASVVLGFEELRLSAGISYFIAAIGTPTNPSVAIATTRVPAQ